LAKVFGEPARKAAAAPLSPNHPVFTLPELTIQKFDYRNYARGPERGRVMKPFHPAAGGRRS